MTTETINEPIVDSIPAETPRKSHRFLYGFLTALVFSGAADVYVAAQYFHEKDNQAQKVNQANLDEVKGILEAEGINLAHMSFSSAGLGKTIKATFEDKAGGKDCRVGLTVYYQGNDKLRPALMYATNDTIIDPTSNNIIKVTPITQPIINPSSQETFFTSISPLCEIPGVQGN